MVYSLTQLFNLLQVDLDDIEIICETFNFIFSTREFLHNEESKIKSACGTHYDEYYPNPCSAKESLNILANTYDIEQIQKASYLYLSIQAEEGPIKERSTKKVECFF